MLETGRFATTTELAAAEKINASYVARILRLTLRAGGGGGSGRGVGAAEGDGGGQVMTAIVALWPLPRARF